MGGVAATHLIEASERVTRSTIESIGAGSSSLVSPPSSAAVLTGSPAAARKGEAAIRCASSVREPTCPPFACSNGVVVAASRVLVTAAAGCGREG